MVRTDGTKEDFSWRICVDGKLPSYRSDVLFALREAVWPQIMDFKISAFHGQPEIPCELTGTLVRIDNCNVDHISPFTFESLVNRWLTERKLSLDEVELDNSPDGYSRRMVNPDQISDWCLYHQQHARLRILSVHAHLSLAKSSRRKQLEAIANQNDDNAECARADLAREFPPLPIPLSPDDLTN